MALAVVEETSSPAAAQEQLGRAAALPYFSAFRVASGQKMTTPASQAGGTLTSWLNSWAQANDRCLVQDSAASAVSYGSFHVSSNKKPRVSAAQVERQREAFRSFDKKELEKSMAATPFISGAEACKRMVLSSIGLNLLWVLQLNNT